LGPLKYTSAKFAYVGSVLDLSKFPIMLQFPQKNNNHFKSGEKRLENNHLLVKIRDTLCISAPYFFSKGNPMLYIRFSIDQSCANFSIIQPVDKLLIQNSQKSITLTVFCVQTIPSLELMLIAYNQSNDH
jgi:hypothetical protein